VSEAAAGGSAAAGARIYDLGYRHYEGARLGRAYAVASLFWYSFRAVWGIGRSTWAKVFPFGLTIVSLVPALISLAVGAVVPEEFELIRLEDYFGYNSIVLALFCAAVAPEIINRDVRTRTLVLYFSRSLSRFDYVTAKLAALGIALFLVTYLSQLLALSGNALGTDDFARYLSENADLFPSVLGGSALAAVTMSGIALAIACQTPRRAWSTGAVIVYFVVATTTANVLLEAVGEDSDAGWVLLFSPIDTLDGAIHFLFGAEPRLDSSVQRSGIEAPYFLLASLAYAAAGLAALYRRFLRLPV